MRDLQHAPHWDPPSDDVVFDQVLATEAAEACRRAAAVAEEAGQTRAQAGVVASRWFHGTFAQHFENRHDDAVALHLEIVAALYRLGGQIESSAIVAADEQRERLALRERWEEEYRRNEVVAEALAEREPDP